MNNREYFVSEYDVEGRIRELQIADSNVISPVHKLQVMILTVLVDIRCLLEKLTKKEKCDGEETV